MCWVKIQWDMRKLFPCIKGFKYWKITENFPLLTLIMWTIGSDTALRKCQINNNVKKSKQTKQLACSNRTEHNFIYFRPSSLPACHACVCVPPNQCSWINGRLLDRFVAFFYQIRWTKLLPSQPWRSIMKTDLHFQNEAFLSYS